MKPEPEPETSLSTPARSRQRALYRKNGAWNACGRQVALARRAHAPPVTQERLSELLLEREGLEISLGTIGKIEAGIRGVADYEVAAIARVLGVRADWLLGV